jgi:hypothetical protein
MEEKYLVISRCEDEPYMEFLSKDELQKRIIEDWKKYNFLNEIRNDNLNYFPARSVFIFKGEIIIPKAEKVVTKWTIK